MRIIKEIFYISSKIQRWQFLFIYYRNKNWSDIQLNLNSHKSIFTEWYFSRKFTANISWLIKWHINQCITSISDEFQIKNFLNHPTSINHDKNPWNNFNPSSWFPNKIIIHKNNQNSSKRPLNKNQYLQKLFFL